MHAPVREQRAVARVEVPARRQFIRIKIRAVHRVRTIQGIDHAVAVGIREDALKGVAVRFHPVHRLLSAVPLRHHQGVLVGGNAGLQVLVFGDRIGPLHRTRDLLGGECG